MLLKISNTSQMIAFYLMLVKDNGFSLTKVLSLNCSKQVLQAGRRYCLFTVQYCWPVESNYLYWV